MLRIETDRMWRTLSLSLIIGYVLCTSLLVFSTAARGEHSVHELGQGQHIPLHSSQANGLYVLQYDSGSPGSYHFTVIRLSPDGSVDEILGELVSSWWLQGAWIFHGAETYFIISRSGYKRDIWAWSPGSSWVTIGITRGHDLASMDSQGRLFLFHRIRNRPANSREFHWRVRSYSGEGLIEEKEYHIIDTTDWLARLGGPVSQRLIPLDNGMWLNVEVGVDPNVEYRPGFIGVQARDWLWYWIVDPEKGELIEKGFHPIEAVSFGTIQGTINGSRVISHDSTGVTIVAITGEYPFKQDQAMNEICLLRFSPEGKPLMPTGVKSEMQLQAVDDLHGPVTQFSAVFGLHGRKLYRLYSMDRMGRITFSDLTRPLGKRE